jgi:hypothetical protein
MTSMWTNIKNTELTSQKIAVEMTKLPMQACEGRRGFGIGVFSRVSHRHQREHPGQ